MHDQVQNLKEKGLKAEYLGSGQKDKTIESKVLSPTGDVQIAFVTPEWLFNVHQLQMLSSQGRIGLNKPDIRYIIRYGVPESLSSWLQELGRAGRDGNPAQAYILYAERDTDNACAWI